MDVPSNLMVWQRLKGQYARDAGEAAYNFFVIPLRDWKGAPGRRLETVRVRQCVECQATWPEINTLGVAWATDYDLARWSGKGFLRCACCPPGYPQVEPRSIVDGRRIIDF